MTDYEVELPLERTSRNKDPMCAIWDRGPQAHGTWAQERRARVHVALRLSTIAAT